MVLEVRKIVLNTDELVDAIDTYRQMTPEFLPAGRIVRCTTSKFGTVTVSIELRRDGFMRTAEFTLGHAWPVRRGLPRRF